MRKVLLVTLILASVAFSYNTVLGNRGTFGVYSGSCEDMGMLTINLNAFGTMINIDSIIPGDSTPTSAQLTEVLPYVALSFTPWHYLEFSLWGHGRYATFGSYSSSTAELYNDLGGSIKGGVPIYFNSRRRSYFAPGIDGFAYMQGIGTNVFGFGGRGLLTLNLAWFGLHLNGGYEYVTLPAGGTGNLLTGAGLEVWPMRWAGILADATARIPQNDFGNFLNYLRVTPGLRLGFGGRVVKLDVNLGVELELMQTPFRWRGLAGLGIGFDLMPTPPGELVDGIVVDKRTSKPVGGARVFIEGYPDIDAYTTDANGRFYVARPEEEFWLRAEHPDYVTRRVNSLELKDEAVLLEMMPVLSGATLVGLVSDADTEHPLTAFIRFVDLASGNVADSLLSEPIAGFYRTELPAGTYRVDVQASGYKKTHKGMILEDGDEEVVDFKLKPVPAKPPPPTLSFDPIYFGRGIYKLSVQNYAVLKDALEVLEAHPDIRVELRGHTDSVGDGNSNYWLSVRRAEMIRDFLVLRGISQDRIHVVGYGETRPYGDNRTGSGRELNRRVDIVVS